MVPEAVNLAEVRLQGATGVCKRNVEDARLIKDERVAWSQKKADGIDDLGDLIGVARYKCYAALPNLLGSVQRTTSRRSRSF